MKKEIKTSILVLIGFLAFLWIEKPVRELLSLSLNDPVAAKHISGIFIRIILIVITALLIAKLRFSEFVGLKPWTRFKNAQAIIIPLSLIFAGIVSNGETYIKAGVKPLVLFILFTLTVGIAEEFAFRGIIFPLTIKAVRNWKRPILIGALLSSLMFGAVHFINLFSQPDNLIGITSQVFFAVAIGVFFCGLMVRTENILVPCLIHALVNYSFGAGELKQTLEETSTISETTGVNWNSLITTTIFFSFILVGGLYMILKSNPENILMKLKTDTD